MISLLVQEDSFFYSLKVVACFTVQGSGRYFHHDIDQKQNKNGNFKKM